MLFVVSLSTIVIISLISLIFGMVLGIRLTRTV